MLATTLTTTLAGCSAAAPATPTSAPTPTATTPATPAAPTAGANRACSALGDSTAPAPNPGLPGGAPSLAPASTPPGPALAAASEGITLEAALRGAGSGPQRAKGEQAARDFLAVLLDTRPALTGKQVVCALAGPDLSPAVGRFLAVERNTLRNPAGPANRRPAAGGGGFYRSVAIGGDAAPSQVRTEFAVPVQADVPKYTAWTIYRVEVGYAAGTGWRLTDYGDNGAGPSGPTLSAADRARFLVGPGWRPLGVRTPG